MSHAHVHNIIEAPTCEVAPEDEVLRGQQVLGRRRPCDAELCRVDIQDLVANRGISMNAVRALSPTSQRCAERCSRRAESAIGQRRQQSRGPLLQHGGVNAAGLGEDVWGVRASAELTVLEMLHGSTDNHRFGFLPSAANGPGVIGPCLTCHVNSPISAPRRACVLSNLDNG